MVQNTISKIKTASFYGNTETIILQLKILFYFYIYSTNIDFKELIFINIKISTRTTILDITHPPSVQSHPTVQQLSQTCNLNPKSVHKSDCHSSDIHCPAE